MPIVEATLSPAGPYSTGAIGTLSAYVDLGGGTPDPSYAGFTAVLCIDLRDNANPDSAALTGNISAVVDSSGVATFTGLTAIENPGIPGSNQAYLRCALIPPGTWEDFYSDSMTDADGTNLAAHDFGALTGPVTGHTPDSTPNTFIWTDFGYYAQIGSNRIQVTDPSHGDPAYITGSYAWSTDVPGNNAIKNCRVAMQVTLDLAATSGGGNLYAHLGLMPNFDAYSDYECEWLFTDTAFYNFEQPFSINFVDYRNSGKWAHRPMTTPTNGVPFTYEMRAFDTWLFVLVDGVYQLGTANDAWAGDTGAMGPFMDAVADNYLGANHMQMNLDNFQLQTFVEGAAESPDIVDYGDAETLTTTVCTGRTQNLRIEARVSRGGAAQLGVGSNLIYRSAGYHSGDSHWAFGCVHSSDSLVTLRYRYSSGGTGDWTTLKESYPWSIGTAQKLIVELDGDVHTFRIADAFGHDERILGRIQDSRAPGVRAGWKVRGTVQEDTLDNFRVMDFNSLVRIKYRLSPDDDRIQIPLWQGQVTSGNSSLITDPTKLWSINELVGAYLRIVSGPGVGSDSVIVANGETSITPADDFLAVPTNGSQYLVYDKYFTGTERLQFWRERGLKEPKYLFYHGERRGAAPEPEQRMLIDANHVAEMLVSISQVQYGVDEGVMRIIVEPDDDVATWELYMRKDAWPTSGIGTANPGPTDEPDTTYLRHRGSTDIKELDIELTNGIWYVLAAPYDTNGYRGPTVGVFMEIVGNGEDPGDGTGGGGGGDGGGGSGTGGDDDGGGIKAWFLETPYAFHPTESANHDIIVLWTFPDNAAFPVADATVDVKVFGPKSPQQFIWVTQDYPVDDKDYTHATIGPFCGDVRTLFFEFGTKNIDPWTTIQFDITLKISGVAVSTTSCKYSNYGRLIF